jgi:hypothetical protein
VAIVAAFEILSEADQAAEAEILEAAISAGLVVVNSGKIAHSISLTGKGLDVCRAAAQG